MSDHAATPTRMGLAALALLALVGAAPLARAQGDGAAEPSLSDLEADWWLSIRGDGNSGGAARLRFGAPTGGVFDVSGFGLDSGFGRFSVADGATLEVTSKRRISGSLVLQRTSGPDGLLVVTDGKLKGDGSRLKLKGTLDGNPVKLRGAPLGDTEPVLSGRNPEAKLRGDGLRSKAFDLSLATDDYDPGGFPLFSLVGEGSVEIDSVETPGVEIDGELIVDPKSKAWGSATSPELGAGPLRGKLVQREDGVPKAALLIDADRRVKLKGNLKEAVDPRIQVQPVGATDFGTLEVGESSERTFLVGNAGAGSLDGEASLRDPGLGWSVVSGSPYRVEAEGAPAAVKVLFEPVAAGEVETELVFSGGGGAVRDLVANAVVASISIDPAETLDLGEVILGGQAEGEFTVRNNTATAINLTARVTSGSPTFRLLTALGAEADSVEVAVPAGATRPVRVRFRAPAEPSDELGVVRFDVDGVQGPTRNVIGSAVP